MSFSTNPIRQILAYTDASRPAMSELNSSARNFSAVFNVVDTACAGVNLIPGVSFFTGIGTATVVGGAKLAFAAFALKDGAPGRSFAWMCTKSAAETIVLGCSAAFLPVFGWYANAAAVGKNAADVMNMVAP